MNKHSCINCHFFVKDCGDAIEIIRNDERDLILKNDFSLINAPYYLRCHFGVWRDRGHKLKNKYEVIIQPNRNNCFFWKFRPGMELPAAEILQKKEELFRETSKDRRYTIIGLWIAAIALSISAVLGITECSRKSNSKPIPTMSESTKP